MQQVFTLQLSLEAMLIHEKIQKPKFLYPKKS